MAIEFRCPHCAAAVRVADSAAGRKGKCPACGAGVLVPNVTPPPDGEQTVSPSTPSLPEAQPPEADDSEVTASLMDSGEEEPSFPGPSDFAETSDDPGFPAPVEEPALRYTRSGRRRRRKRASNLMIPLLCGAVLLGVVGWFVYRSHGTTDLEGELTAVARPGFNPSPGYVEKADIDLPADPLKFVLDGLAEDPERLKSSSMTVELRGTPEGIQVDVFSTAQSRFVMIDVTTDAGLRNYYRNAARKLGRRRRRQVRTIAERFCRDWKEKAEQNTSLDDPVAYRDELGLGALVGGFGYSVAAVVERKLYPCVYEDTVNGRLYFLLPREARRFTLRGREFSDGSVLFPGRFTVKVVEKDDTGAAGG